MDSFYFQNIKAEKANAMLRYRRLQKLTALFRLVEVGVFLIILSRFSTLLPIAFKLSGEYIKGLIVSLFSPRLVFIIGNVIVIVLFLKSGQSAAKEGGSENSKADFYDEYVKSCQRNQVVQTEESEKQREKRVYAARESTRSQRIQRSQSENLKNSRYQEPRHELRRSGTERCLESVDTGDRKAITSYAVAVDEMSNEEFRNRVEAFIARQQRFLKEEEEFSAFLPVDS